MSSHWCYEQLNSRLKQSNMLVEVLDSNLWAKGRFQVTKYPHRFQLGLHFGSKKTDKMSIGFEDLSKKSVFFRTEVKPYTYHETLLILIK